MNAILQPSAALALPGASSGVSDAEMAASVVIPRGELERLYRDVLAGMFHPSDDESAHNTVANAWLGPLETP